MTEPATRKRTTKKSKTSPNYRIAFLTPWRAPYRHISDDSFPWRERNFAWQQEQFAERGLDSFVSDDGASYGPFSLARAVNRAAELPGEEFTHFLIFGADHALPTNAELSDVLHRASGLPESPGWAPVWSRTKFLSRPATAAILKGRHSPRDEGLHLAKNIRACPGPTLVSREAFDRSGGHDERFEGWGGEDLVFRHRLEKLVGPAIPPPDPMASCYTLWHPAGSHRTPEITKRNRELRNRACAEIDALVAESNGEEVTQSDDHGE